jgi:hypothetical protein
VPLVIDQLKERAPVGLGAFFFECGLEVVFVERGAILDGDVAAGAGQRVDAGEQLLLRGGRQVDQRALGNPR